MNNYWNEAIARANRLAAALKCNIRESYQVFSGTAADHLLCRLIGGRPCVRVHPANVQGHHRAPDCPARGRPVQLDHVAVFRRGRKAVAISNEPYFLPDGYESELDRYCKANGLLWRRTDSVGTWNPLQTKAMLIWRADTPDLEALLDQVDANFDREAMRATMEAWRAEQAAERNRQEAQRERWRLKHCG